MHFETIVLYKTTNPSSPVASQLPRVPNQNTLLYL